MASTTSTSTSSSSAIPRTLSIPATPYAGEEKTGGATKSQVTHKQVLKSSKGKARQKDTVKVKAEPQSEPALGYAASDDETQEAEAAQKSPPKHGARLTSAVSCCITSMSFLLSRVCSPLSNVRLSTSAHLAK